MSNNSKPKTMVLNQMYICNQCDSRTDLAVSFVFPSVLCHDFYFCSAPISLFFLHPFLGAFAKLRKTTIILIFVRPPHGTTRLSLDEFSLNSLLKYF